MTLMERIKGWFGASSGNDSFSNADINVAPDIADTGADTSGNDSGGDSNGGSDASDFDGGDFGD